MFKYAQVALNRSETTKLTISVPPWEVPVMQAVHGSDVCQVVGEVEVRRELPDADSEFVRLTNRYKDEKKSGQQFVEIVYGVGSRGVEALRKEIAKVAEVSATGETGDVGGAAGGSAADPSLAELGLEDDAVEIT